jgi:hypothetical protein
MPLIVEPVPNALLFDTDVKLTRPALQALFDMGFRGSIRYVGIHGPSPEDIDGAEVDDHMAVGLGLMLVQHVRDPGWLPNAQTGQFDGEVAAELAKACGYLAGASLWDDLEGIGPSGHGDPSATIGYANTKFDAVASEGYPQGEYIGFDVPLSSSELFHALKARIYWRSFSNVPDVATRGYAMRQLVETQSMAIGNVPLDLSIMEADRLGGRPFWMRFAA